MVNDLVWAEVAAARRKFPDPEYLTTALSEEAGEAVRAIMEHMYVRRQRGGAAAEAAALAEVRKELIQTAAMCVRLLEEGDPIHWLTPAIGAGPDVTDADTT